ncbi:MAG: dihydropteroate synthase [Gammaproteobacteria bacterium SG8_15]|nr:MAG: dihydropteroate synthase [Gammaproteobacteria bacterium SG8_15]
MSNALRCADKTLDLSSPCVMGILNVTPDSFSDGGHFFSSDNAVEQSRNMIAAGAAIIDIGGESTRPGAQEVSIDEERRRVLPVIKRLHKEFPDTIISVDTSKPEIMSDAIDAGAGLVNDVNALRQPGALEAVADSNVAVCLMHMQGQPRTMQDNPHYDNVVEEVKGFLQHRIEACVAAGIKRNRIIIDPGFGFGKTLQHNLLLLKNLEKFKHMGVALLVGMSRKSMIGTVLDKPVDERLIGSISLATLSLWLGANILRVHDVAQTVEALKIVNAVRSV